MSSLLRSVYRWSSHQPGVDLDLACVEHPDPSGDPRRVAVRATVCLAEIDPHEVVETLGAGAATVALRLDGCVAAERVHATFAPVLRLLAECGVDRLRLVDHAPARAAGRGRRRGRDVLGAAAMPVPRRQVLGLGGTSTVEMPDESLDPARRLVEALRRLVPTACLAISDGPATRLTADGCTACGVCVRACPNDALRVRRLGATVTTVQQDLSGCDGCRRCIDLCPADALAAAGSWPWSWSLSREVLPIASLATATCRRCDGRFPTSTGESLCPVCAFRRANPFASAVPPGASGLRFG